MTKKPKPDTPEIIHKIRPLEAHSLFDYNTKEFYDSPDSPLTESARLGLSRSDIDRFVARTLYTIEMHDLKGGHHNAHVVDFYDHQRNPYKGLFKDIKFNLPKDE